MCQFLPGKTFLQFGGANFRRENPSYKKIVPFSLRKKLPTICGANFRPEKASYKKKCQFLTGKSFLQFAELISGEKMLPAICKAKKTCPKE
jgi:hypothetical protein